MGHRGEGRCQFPFTNIKAIHCYSAQKLLPSSTMHFVTTTKSSVSFNLKADVTLRMAKDVNRCFHMQSSMTKLESIQQNDNRKPPPNVPCRQPNSFIK